MINVNKVLVPVDGSERSLEAIEMVKSLFVNHPIEIHLLNVVEVNYIVQESIQKELIVQSNEVLDHAGELLENYTVVKSSIVGTPYKDIIEYASKEKVDLIVMTRMGLSGFQRYLIGSVTSKVVAHSPIPVIVIPEKPLD